MRVYLGAALALAVLGAGAWRFHAHVEHGRKLVRSRQRLEDQHSLRSVAALVIFAEELPMEGGVLDPYDVVRRGYLSRENYGLLRSRRFGGPTDDEIESGDYTRFPWERYSGERRARGAPPFPLLWDKRPDEDGWVLVALSDGTTHKWDAQKLERALAEAGIGR